ncbi:MAG TPA: hypothetical protein VF950_29620 [Planctomycetota bacterium]
MRHKLQFRTLIALLAVASVLPACGGGGGGGGGGSSVTTILVSSSGAVTPVPGNGDSDQPSVSADGRFVAFRSVSTNLVAPPTTAARSHIYKKDLQTGAIQLISAAGAAEGSGNSSNPAISSDGRFIAYTSFSTNLVAGVTITGAGAISNVYLCDTLPVTPTTTLLSFTAADGTVSGGANSGNPSIAVTAGPIAHVAYESAAQDIVVATYTASPTNIFCKRTGGSNELVSVSTTAGTAGNGSSVNASISADGQRIAFDSTATNLIAGDTNGQTDVFVRDFIPVTDTTTRVSVLNAGGEITGGGSFAPNISGDGLSVVFLTQGTNVDVADVTPNDIYMRVNWAAGASTVQISEHPTTTGTGNSCQSPATNTDGSIIVWNSASFELVNGDANQDRDVFRRNRNTNVLDRVSLTAAGGESGTGVPANATATLTRPATSSTGAFVVFDSNQTDLITPATTVRHVFRRG